MPNLPRREDYLSFDYVVFLENGVLRLKVVGDDLFDLFDLRESVSINASPLSTVESFLKKDGR